MPTWGEILSECNQYFQQHKKPPFDTIRRRYIALLSQKTKRNTILYATNWTGGRNIPASFISIMPDDIQGFGEVVSGLEGESLDLIIHSPGGSAEAAERIVTYLRDIFTDIRVFVPHAAMSAATMLACSANEIVMGKESSLGPIDPQLIMQNAGGMQVVPAMAVIEQFEWIRKEISEKPHELPLFVPLITQFGPALLKQCEHSINLAKELVSEWLIKYMFQSENGANQKAINVAHELSDHTRFKSHGRFINREQAKQFGLKVTDLEVDDDIRDLVMSIYHATTHTFSGTSAVKIIENQLGKAFVKKVSEQIIPITGPTIQKPVPKPIKSAPQPKKSQRSKKKRKR
jgi:hypothetical protein